MAPSAALRLPATEAVGSLLFVESGHLLGSQRLSFSGRLLSQREHLGRPGPLARRRRPLLLGASCGSRPPALPLRGECLLGVCKHVVPESGESQDRSVVEGPPRLRDAAGTCRATARQWRAIGIRRCGRPPPRPVAALSRDCASASSAPTSLKAQAASGVVCVAEADDRLVAVVVGCPRRPPSGAIVDPGYHPGAVLERKRERDRLVGRPGRVFGNRPDVTKIFRLWMTRDRRWGARGSPLSSSGEFPSLQAFSGVWRVVSARAVSRRRCSCSRRRLCRSPGRPR